MVDHKYSTVGGVFTRGEAFAQLIHHLSEAADFAAMLAHLHRTESGPMEDLIAKGWLGVHQRLLLTRDKLIELAKRNFQ